MTILPFAETVRLPHSDEHGAIIFEAINEGMAPFRNFGIEVFLEYDIDFHRYRIFAVVHLRGGGRLSHRELSAADDWACDPLAEIQRITELMRDAFRYRDDWPLPPLIKLGEN